MALATGVPAHAAPPVDVRALYRQALQRMANMPEPPVVAYTATIRATGSTFYVGVEPNSGEAEFGIAIGALGANTKSWPVVVRTADGSTTIALEGGSAQTAYPIFDATWFGAYTWLRYGFDGKPRIAPSETPVPSPAGTPAPEPSVEGLIAVVRAINIGFYRVVDRGDDRCENGDAARRVRLIANGDPDEHPATDASIDLTTKDICTLGFDLRPTQFLAQSGYVLLHFARVGDYAMVTDGHIEFNTKFHGIGRRRVDIDLRYGGVTFPSP